MIELTKLNNKKVVINSDLIESVEAMPDATISLITGNKFVVRETVPEVVDKIIEFKQKCNNVFAKEKGGSMNG